MHPGDPFRGFDCIIEKFRALSHSFCQQKYPQDGNYNETGKDGEEAVVRYPTVIAILDVVDTICIVYFTLEYAVRFMCAPKKLRFILQPMNQAGFIGSRLSELSKSVQQQN